MSLRAVLILIASHSIIAAANPIHEFIVKQDMDGLCNYIDTHKPNYRQFMKRDEKRQSTITLAKETGNKLIIELVERLAKFLRDSQDVENSIKKFKGLASPLHTLVYRQDLFGLHFYLAYNDVNYDEFMELDRNGLNILELARDTENKALIEIVYQTEFYLRKYKTQVSSSPHALNLSFLKMPKEKTETIEEDSLSSGDRERVLSPRREVGSADHLFFME